MCGIAGIVGPNASAYETKLQAMLQSIKHRGPDGEKYANLPGAILGHRRLGIVDLVTGDQPMQNQGITVVFNGEIYGYKAIREKFPAYPYKTASDTEVILTLYAQHRTNVPLHLPGMFAFALWDEEHQRLLCARDRFGEKPFYYAFGKEGAFVFASELKAILASGLVQPVIDPASVSAFLQRLYVPPDRTIYSNIYCLPAAHSLVFEKGKASVMRYWTIPPPGAQLSPDEAQEQFVYLFKEAVKKQLVADVPVGAFLSGGLDSGSVVAMAAPQLSQGLQTFSFGFNGQQNELAEARAVAMKYDTIHEELLEDDVDVSGLFEKMCEVYDEPFADSSNIPTFLICRFASKKMKVVLSGDGGDELMGGYPSWYHPLLKGKRHIENQLWWRVLIHALVPAGAGSEWLRNNDRLIKDYRGNEWFYKKHLNQNRYFNTVQLRDLGLPAPYQAGMNFARTNTLDDAFRMDLMDYLPGNILVKTDRAAMANSLEVRCPFLDVDLASFCISLPWSMKVDEFQTKKLLRTVSAQWLPQGANQLSKKGFGAPVDRWLDQSRMKELKNDLFSSPLRIRSYLDWRQTDTFIKKNDYQTWALLSLALWFEKHG